MGRKSEAVPLLWGRRKDTKSTRLFNSAVEVGGEPRHSSSFADREALQIILRDRKGKHHKDEVAN